MQILFVTPAFPPFPGGGERYVGALAGNLARRGHHVSVITSAARREREFWRGRTASPGDESDVAARAGASLAVTRLPLRRLPGGRLALLAWRKSMVLLSALPGDQSRPLLSMARLVPPIADLQTTLAGLPGPYDLVHSFNISWEHALVAGWRLARQAGLPFVVTPFAHFGAGGRDQVWRNSAMDHQRLILRQADQVQALTVVEEEGLRNLGVPAERVTTVGAGLEPLPQARNGDYSSETGSRAALEPAYAIFIGRASGDKGAIQAAEAILGLRRQGRQIKLAVVGQSAPDFDRFYRRLNAAERDGIRLFGVVAEAEKHALLQGSAMLLLPSRTDSFGIVLLEAWAHGKPVVAARAGGIAGVVEDGQDGLLVEYGNVSSLRRAIESLLADEPRRLELGRRGQAKVAEQYTWEGVTSRVLAGYDRVVRAS